MILSSRILRSFTNSKFLVTSMSGLSKCRNFGKSARNRVKMLMEHENKHAYSIMENAGYAITLNVEKIKTSLLQKEQFDEILEENGSKMSPKELFEHFALLADYCAECNLCISDKRFDKFIDHLTDNIQCATKKQLESLCYSLAKFPEPHSIRIRNYIEVWAALDDECLNRIQTWSFDEILSFVSLFFMLNVIKVSDFSKKAIQRLASKAKQLTPSQLVQTLFFISVVRQQPFDMYNLELHLENIFEELTVDQLAIISMGFFKSKTPIRSTELVSKIVDTVMKNSKQIHEVSLAALVKLIRYSAKVRGSQKIYELLENLQHEVPRLSIMCNVHIALMGTSSLTLHEGCLTKIADKTIDTITDARLKDLERLVLTFSTFIFRPPTKECFFQKVLDELRNSSREPEIDKYGRTFISCLEYLGLLGIYPVDLMSKALSPELLEKTFGKRCYNYCKAALAVHNTSVIFCKDATMNRLSDKAAKILAKKYTDYVPEEEYSKQYNITEKMFLDVLKILKQDRGKNFVTGDHILTHHQRGDIIICNDHHGMPLPVAEKFNPCNFGLIRRPPDDNQWIVLIIAGKNVLIQNSNRPTGQYQVKVRELKALGFHATLVPWNIYNILTSNDEKIDFLHNLIEEAIKQ